MLLIAGMVIGFGAGYLWGNPTTRKRFLSAFTSVLLLSACSKEKVAFDTSEEARRQIRDNVTFLAQSFRAENKLTDYDILVRGDSTVSRTCPQGDGWASVDLMHKQGGEKRKLKCSTVSLGIGCMTEDDFLGRAYASEENKCNPDVPFPLPKIKQ